MADSYFIKSRGRTLGPYTLLQCQQMARKGQLARTSEISTDNSNWSQASNYPEVFERPRDPIIIEPAPAGPPDPGTDSLWYYALNGEQKGPTSNENILAMVRAGSLTGTDRVWKEGLDNWVQVSDIGEFGVALIVVSPVEPLPTIRTGLGAPGEVFCRECGTALKRRAVVCPQCGVPTIDDDKGTDHGPSKQTYNPTGSAIAGLVLGIIGLLLFWIPIPFVDISITVVGLVLSAKGMKSTNRGAATGGLVLNIIGLILTVLYWVCIVLVLIKLSP